MVINMRVVSVQEAVAEIRDGSALVSAGFIGCSIAEYIFKAIEKEFLDTGHPNNITLVWGAALGDASGRGIDHLGHEGLVCKAVTAHLNLVPKLQALIDENKIPAHILPLGVIAQLFRESGSGRPGLITKIGLGTYVDPRISGGKANEATKENIVDVIQLGSEEYLHYHNLPMDVAVLRGTTADERGNISMEREAVLSEAMVVAQAVKRNGGTVIVEVERLCQYGSLKPRDVVIPGFMVDYVVVAPVNEHPMILAHPEYSAALAHEFRVPMAGFPVLPMGDRKIIARRAAQELRPGQIVNLGFGMPEGISSVAAEIGCTDKITLTVESGHVGGTPNAGQLFGSCLNSDYNVDLVRQMDWYDGGALDIAFLGAAEVDRFGNANVTRFKGRTVGPGGFINIAHTAKKVCYCGTLTAGGLKLSVSNGRLNIDRDGAVKKYVRDVEQISFSGAAAVKAKQKVLFITERAVFELTEEGLILTEVAPGIDVQTQVLDQIEFEVKISPTLKQMDACIFRDEAMALPLLQNP